MSGLNKVFLLGNLGQDPETNSSATKFSLATSKSWMKGKKVFVEGELRYGSYEKDGLTKYTTDIVADKVQFLDGGKPVDKPDDEQLPPPPIAAKTKVKNYAPGSEDTPF